MSKNKEIEVRFLEIDVEKLKSKLLELGAIDLGEDLLDEIIFYDKDDIWRQEQKLIRVRTTKQGTLVAFKHHEKHGVDGAHEIEFKAKDSEAVLDFLNATGLFIQRRHQQKKRHAFTLSGVNVDIDTWPNIPSFVELEGTSEDKLKEVAAKLNLDWSKADMTNAARVIESYGIPVKTLTEYTFEAIK